MDLTLKGEGITRDPALSSSVTWNFGSQGSCSGGVLVHQYLTVWGQPPNGPPPSAYDYGAQLKTTKYCCTVDGGGAETSGRCVDKYCELDTTKQCRNDEDCGICNMVLTLEENEKVDRKYDPDCKYLMASSRMRFNFLNWQSNSQLTGKKDDLKKWNNSIIIARDKTPSNLPSGDTAGSMAVDSLILEADSGSWPLTICDPSGSEGPFRHSSEYMSKGCRGCTDGTQCSSPDRINCLNARLEFSPPIEPSWSFLIVVLTGAALFLGSWLYLFCSVNLLADAESTDDQQQLVNNARTNTGEMEQSPYINRRSQLRCGSCGASIDNKNMKFCAFCGKSKSGFLSYDLTSGTWK